MNTRFLVLFLVLLAWVGDSDAQFRTRYVQTYGGNGSDEARDVEVNSDGSIVIAGYTSSWGEGGNDLFLMKCSARGIVLWQHTYGGSGQDGYEWVALRKAQGGGYVLCGESDSSPAAYRDFLVVRTDADGNVLWQRCYGGGDEERPRDLRVTPDGGLIIVGFTRSYGAGPASYYAVKTNADGEVQWTRNYGGAAIDDAHSVDITHDGGYIMAGYTTSFGSGPADLYVVRTNAQGNTVWTHTYGGNGSEGVAEYVRIRTLKDGYAIASFTTSSGNGGKDAYFVKTDDQGSVLWTHTYGGSGNDDARDFLPVRGGFVLVGYTYSMGQSGDLYLVSINSSGREMWSGSYGGPGTQIGYSLDATANGIVAVGSTSTGNGDIFVVNLFSGASREEEVVSATPRAPTVQEPLADESIAAQFSVGEGYPNPFNSQAQINYTVPQAGPVEITVYNALGRLETISETLAASGSNIFTLNRPMSSGVHFVEFRYEKERIMRKVLYLK